MAIVVGTPTKTHVYETQDGTPVRTGTQTVTGLTAGAANTVPHGLPFMPTKVNLRPSALGLWAETAIPDATNYYVTVGAGGATSGNINYEE